MPEFKLGNGDVVEFEYVVNPSGAVHDVAVTHPSQTIRSASDRTPITVVELARERKEGWRLATKEEIAAYREKNLIGDNEAHSTLLAQRKVAADKAAAISLAKELEAEATAEIEGPKASVAAAALAAENEIDLSTVEGTGAGGNITKGDVEKAIAAKAEG